MWIYTGNKSAKFHGYTLSPSENIARSFRGATFFDSHCIPAFTCTTENRVVKYLKYKYLKYVFEILGKYFVFCILAKFEMYFVFCI